MPVELEIRTHDNQIRRVPLDESGVSLGRAHTNDLCYPEDASLSRRHLRIEAQGDGFVVADQNSKNGTFLNNERIQGPRRLQPGDQLAAGQLTLRFLDPDRPAESVVFEQSSDLNPQATVVTSLEGLLSNAPTANAGPPPATRGVDPRAAFDLPVVRVLIRAGRELGGDQPLEELFGLILDLSIEAVGAERGVLMTLEGERLVSRAVHGDGFRISTLIRDRVMDEKTSILVRNVQDEDAIRNQLSISEQQIHSLMAVPLQTESDVIGLIYVDSRMFVREFTPDDLNLLTVLANVAAIRIYHQRYQELRESERRRTRDLEQAAEIQRGILPAEAPQVPGLELAGHNAPCRTVGGDYYDFVPYADGRWGLVVGDVAGKGMSAALLMTGLQARVQLLVEDGESLAEVMSRLDRSIASRCPQNRFITLFVFVIDPETGQAVYCNAGHNPAFIVRASGRIDPLTSMGTVLGILPELGYVEKEESLQPGDLIAIYSDGVTEAMNAEEEEFGEERLGRTLVENRERPAAEIVCAVNEALTEWTGEGSPDDDVTLVVARRVPT